MGFNEKSVNSIVKISVIDDPSLGFFFDLDNNSIVDEQDSNILLKVDKETYSKLVDGSYTFEYAVSKGMFKISGDAEQLRLYGKNLRNSTKIN